MKPDAAMLTAVYTEWKMVKTRSALVLCFEVPLEQQELVQKVLGTPLQGESTHVVIARLVNGAMPVVATEPEALPPPRRGSLAQQAAMLCHEVAFQLWLSEVGTEPVTDADAAAVALRRICGVGSRADLDSNELASRRFHDLRADYKLWLNGVAAA